MANGTDDWFLSAVTAEGSVSRCLSAVLAELKRKQEFLTCINQKLSGEGNIQSDKLTQLGKDVKELENTLRFRLGLLRVDQQAAWFRKTGRKDYGPFRSAMLMEPVFAPYRPEQLDELSVSIKTCWQSAKVAPLSFSDQSPCLWRILLEKKKQMDEMASLSGLFSQFRLDQLPDELPKDLESRALRAFLLNVRTEFISVRDRLNICFDQLWTTSEKFWHFQREELKKTKRKSPGANKQSHHQSDAKARDEKKEQEKESQYESTYSEKEMQASFAQMEALRFMGFRNLPSKESLRKRYLELAKSMHPDLGGSDEAFKRLSNAYRSLLDRSP